MQLINDEIDDKNDFLYLIHKPEMLSDECNSSINAVPQFISHDSFSSRHEELKGPPSESDFCQSHTYIFTKDSMFNQIPKSYRDLQAKFIVPISIVSKRLTSFGAGEINVSVIPQGKYKIYYMRPLSKDVPLEQRRLTKVGKGKEFNVFYLSGSV